MIILGAGLSGLIAGNMLRRFKPKIFEAQSELPNNHAALLRFRSRDVSNACAIPFKKVKVRKAVYFKDKLHHHADLEMMNLYSRKVTGEYQQRSIENLEPVERYISPPDFIEQASQHLQIEYSKTVDRRLLFDHIDAPAISTIPMDKMMELMLWDKKPEFKYMPIWSVTCDIIVKCDLYQTIYFPEDAFPYYRCSITGNKLIVEFNEDPKDLMGDDNVHFINDNAPFAIIDALTSFGVIESWNNLKIKHQKYGKLLPIDDRLRKEFMLWLTREFNIYSLGRFATWRQILLDDVVKDVNVIESLMHGSGYENNKHWSAA